MIWRKNKMIKKSWKLSTLPCQSPHEPAGLQAFLFIYFLLLSSVYVLFFVLSLDDLEES